MSASTAVNPTSRHPLSWIPTLYFSMSVPMITVSVVAAIMYRNLGLTNTEATLYTGSMYLPWVAKALWSPLVDFFKTKKFIVVGAQITMAVSLGCIALALPLPHYLPITVALFWLIAFFSATHDIAADGVYLHGTTGTQKARYVSVLSICSNTGRIFTSGFLVWLTGKLHSTDSGPGLSWTHAWMIAMGLISVVMLVLGLLHRFTIPSGGEPVKTSGATLRFSAVTTRFREVFASYFQKKGIVPMLAFVLFYRLGEGLLDKLAPLFMLDDRSAGGLGLDNMAVGKINGTFGPLAFIIGTLIGGEIAARFGLKRTLVLFSLMLNVPHLTFVYLSFSQPTDIHWITLIVVIEKLGYGIGFVALLLYMMQQVAPGKYKTEHYAISTGFMALCMMTTGMLSGYLQHAVGYPHFFLIIMGAMIPSLLVSWLAPFPIDTSKEATPASA
jgi:MFS transporter, PAT family, beta-lactamase induction signal transducer AmpG